MQKANAHTHRQTDTHLPKTDRKRESKKIINKRHVKIVYSGILIFVVFFFLLLRSRSFRFAFDINTIATVEAPLKYYYPFHLNHSFGILQVVLLLLFFFLLLLLRVCLIFFIISLLLLYL